MEGIFGAWGLILAGRTPCLSIEITRECPLTCPGCYAYGTAHLGGDVLLREVSDYTGDALVEGILGLVRKHKPIHISLVGGEPLVRYRELNVLLPRLAEMGIHTQLVTSAVRQIPLEWDAIPRLQIVVSVDGLQPEHDERRKPATYDRILKHMAGHEITIHCTVTRQQTRRPGYLEEFLRFWSGVPSTRRVWISLYTPQIGEISEERLTDEDRKTVVEELSRLRLLYPKFDSPQGLIDVYARPPRSPEECAFSRLTECVSADLKKRITPCQFGGKPDCSNCGCIASAGIAAITRHELPIGVRVGTFLEASFKIGAAVNRVRGARPDAARERHREAAATGPVE